MRALEHAVDVTLPDHRVAVLGDMHGNVGWLRLLARALPALAPDITTVMQLGDWWMPSSAVDEIFGGTNIERIYVTLGNHEPWGEITPLLNAHPGDAVRISDIIWLLPRPARLSIGGRHVLSLGGAVSVDRASREEGKTWWPEEEITDEDVAAAIAGGPADLMLTHESPSGTPVRRVREILRTNPHRFPVAALAASAASRARVGEVWDATRPELLVHGHMHVAAGGRADDGRRVACLGRDAQEGNLGLLDMNTLMMSTPSLRAIRNSADQSHDDDAARKWRAKGAAEALHSGVLDGLKPTPDALRDAQDYIEGRRTLDELIEDVRRRHTRRPQTPRHGEEGGQ